jgi:hypothetical protein
MKKENIRLLAASIIFSIILFSIFVVITQNEIENIKISDNPGKDFPLFVKIFTDENKGIMPFKIKFESIVINNKGGVSYHWDFGDNETSDLINPTHIYEKVGIYNCTLTVTDIDKKEAKNNVIITVLQKEPPRVQINVDKTSGNRPVRIHFDAECFEIEGEIQSYKWEITYPILIISQKVVKKSEKNFSLMFIRPGMYEVKLVVTDDAGNSVTEYLKIQIFKSKVELFLSSALYTITTLNTIKDIINALRPK